MGWNAMITSTSIPRGGLDPAGVYWVKGLHVDESKVEGGGWALTLELKLGISICLGMLMPPAMLFDALGDGGWLWLKCLVM